MSANTKIEWCDATLNHWTVCTPVSPACDNCYAKAMAKRLWGVGWGAGVPRHQFHGAATALHALSRKAERLGRRFKVFHNSLSDIFDNEVPVQWRIDAMRAIIHTPDLIHLLLTKRIGNAAEMLNQAFREVSGRKWADYVLPNVWIGATVVNQEEADRDIPKLLAVPAAKRFLSMEPLLGPVDLGLCDCDKGSRPGPGGAGGVTCPHCNGSGGRMLDWVIVGGESGPNARPMHPDWARSLRDQCQSAGVPFLFKQWGEWISADQAECPYGGPLSRWVWADGTPYREYATQREIALFCRAGKKAAGRLLDGGEWNGVPA